LKRILLSLLFAANSLALGQATSTASRTDFQVGGTFTFVKPDYTPQNAVGFGIYTDYFFRDHIGVELDYNHADILQHKPATETTFEYGGIYRRVYGRFRPYARGAFGRGGFNFPSQTGSQTSVANLSYNLWAVGGGVDVEVLRFLNVRGEVVYQHWFAADGLTQGLTPTLYTVGVAYDFNPRRPRY
jgi:hypothetical protein